MKTINEFLSERNLLSFDVSKQDLKTIAKSVIKTLIPDNETDPVLFRHGNAPVWLEADDQGRLVFREITQDRMRALLGRRYGWFRFNRNGNRIPKWPPIEVVRDLLAFPNLDLPIVDMIVSVPVFAPDGTIQVTAGYSAATRRIYLPGDDLEALLDVPDAPDSDDIRTALAFFDELMIDFPFVYPGKTHALAALLVPFARAFIKGPTPLHLFEKPTPGTGATLLAQVICDICIGYPVAAMTESRNEDEFARKIHSKLRSGPAVILLDNLRNRLDSAALAAALTGDLFEDRLIQNSETLAAPVKCLWLGTANNPSLSGEIARRTVPIRLDARMPRPHLRTGFRQPKLREWVSSHRACLIWSMLTIVRAWIGAGRPNSKKVLGMYESYSEVIGGILEVANVPGFLDIPEEQARLEDEESDLAPLIPPWRQKFQFEPVSAAQLLPLCTEVDLGGKTEQERKIRLGKLLRANRDRVFGEVSIVTAGSRDGSNLWRLMPTVGESSTNGQDCEPARATGVGELGECFASSPSRKNE